MNRSDAKRLMHDAALLGAAVAAFIGEHFWHLFSATGDLVASHVPAAELIAAAVADLAVLLGGALLGLVVAGACLRLGCREAWRLLIHGGRGDGSPRRKMF